MKTYEFEGKTDQDAIENACRELKLEKDQMDIVILEPGSAGIFGLVGGRKAKIKVTIKEEKKNRSNRSSRPLKRLLKHLL
jgi:spoIIIJ-associated protein